MPTTAATRELEPLEIFIGKWINEGETVGTLDTPAVRILTSDVYEWVPGGFFVLHSAYGRIGEMEVGGAEIISYDAETNAFRTHFFTSQGAITTETLTLENGAWLWQGEKTRATSVFSGDGKTQTCLHERRTDAETWVTAMNVRLSKVE